MTGIASALRPLLTHDASKRCRVVVPVAVSDRTLHAIRLDPDRQAFPAHDAIVDRRHVHFMQNLLSAFAFRFWLKSSIDRSI